MPAFIRTFTAAGNEFEALNEARSFLAAHGFSVGSLQRGAPIGVMFGDYKIAKWRNLDSEDIADLHGRLESKNGSFRTGPITLRIRSDAPQAVHDALKEGAAA